MYLEVTTECNMRCKHCCMDSKRVGKGKYMDMRTFYRATSLLSQGEEYYHTVGGGEPTLHPHIVEIIGSLLMFHPYNNVGIVTNGTRARKLKELFKLKEQFSEQLRLELSMDQFHTTKLVTQTAKDLFSQYKYSMRRPIDPNQLVRQGRAASNNMGTNWDKSWTGRSFWRCACSDVTIRVDGSIYPCGCNNAPLLGNVNNVEDVERMSEYVGKAACWNSEEEYGWHEYRERYYQVYMSVG